jgi:hypothetical protein
MIKYIIIFSFISPIIYIFIITVSNDLQLYNMLVPYFYYIILLLPLYIFYLFPFAK